MVLRACLGAGALALLLVSGGCSDDPQPRVEPTVDSPAPSPMETTSAEPEAWEVKSSAGAVAFAKHWMAVFSAAMRSGNTQELRRISGRECDVCTAFADRLDAIERNNGFYKCDGWTISWSDVSGPLDDRAVLALKVRQGAERFRETWGAPIESNPTSKAAYSMTLAWGVGEWQVVDFRAA